MKDLQELASKYILKDDIYLFNTGNAVNAWKFYGCTYIPEEGLHRFVVWAPNAKRVSLTGEFNGWNNDADVMTPYREGGIWFIFKEGLSDGMKYKFCIDGADGRRVLKADPFAAFSENGSETASIIWCTNPYTWGDGEYLEKRRSRNFLKEPMSIYEIHCGSWKDFGQEKPIYSYLGEQASQYCKEMHYTHVEIMPITEFPFDDSWGYQVTGYYSPTSRYGNPEDFKYFVDCMHRKGIGVIMDWVPAHFPKDEHGLANFDGSPQFESKEKRMAEHPEWGTLIFDYESSQVRSFLISSACKFFEEFHIDGIRVDAVSSMLYLNYGRKNGNYTPNKFGGNTNLGAVEFLRHLNSSVLSRYPGTVTIAEESTAFPLITAPPDAGGLGFCFKWDMGFMHDTIDYMSLNPFFRSNNHNKLTFSMMYAFSENFILAYSHDEVVHGKASMINKMYGTYEEKFAALRTLYGYQYAHPGKKHTFMGSEFGQFIEWNYRQQLDWLLLDYPLHKAMQDYSRALNSIYVSSPALYRIDNSWDGFRWLNVNDNMRSSIAFLRTSDTEGKGKYLVCVCNFTTVSYEGFVIGLPQKGTLTEILNSDDTAFGGTGTETVKTIESRKEAFLDMDYSAELTLPANSCIYYEYEVTADESDTED